MQTEKVEAGIEYFDPLFNLKEVGKIIRAERSTLYNLMRDGKLNAVKLGGSTLVRRSELDRYLATAKPAEFRKPTIN